MEASALHAPRIGRLGLTAPLLRLRSDEQLVALFRAGSDEAFAIIHDRFRQRLFAYVRQMLSSSSRADAEDVLQDVFVRAYGALRADERDVNLKAWLYRVAHNRCVDYLRRPTPPASDVFEVSRTPLLDPIETAQRRDDLKRLVEDVGRLPEQQRSALLMREIDGLPYADIAAALDATVPAVKSLLVRARVGLVEAIEARDTDCAVIRSDLAAAYDRGVKASGRARKHMRECAGCREYRGALRCVRKSFAALSPIGAAGPIAFVLKALGGSGAAAGGGAAVGGSAAVGTATACKVAAVVCGAALTAGAGVEVKRITDPDRAASSSSAAAASAPRALAPAAAALSAPRVSADVIRHRTDAAAAPATRRRKGKRDAREAPAADAPEKVVPLPIVAPDSVSDEVIRKTTGGAVAPTEDPSATPVAEDPAGAPATGTGTDGATSAPAEDAATEEPPAAGGQQPSSGSGHGPPSEH